MVSQQLHQKATQKEENKPPTMPKPITLLQRLQRISAMAGSGRVPLIMTPTVTCGMSVAMAMLVTTAVLVARMGALFLLW